MKPSKQTLDFPATTAAAQHAAVLSGRFASVRAMRRDQIDDEGGFIRRSADHVHAKRKTMAVCDCHNFAAFAAFGRADTRPPFFAELKLASMNDSLRSSFPRSPKSSASFGSERVSTPERCHCWKRR